MTGKKVPKSFSIGQQGVNLIERVVLKIGFLWHPSGPIEVGIDGIIEVCDPNSGEILNCIIRVQSKATAGPFLSETSTAFEYICKEEDLQYWLGGNAPVILVVSRPSTDEAYWVSIKDYFKTPELVNPRKIRFDKTRDKFDEECRPALLELAVPKDSGIYFSPSPFQEKLYANLLPVLHFGKKIFVAETDARTVGDLWANLAKLGGTYGGDWIMKSKQILSFADLTEFPWNKVCDQGTVEEFDSNDWAFSDDPNKRRDFVNLLNRSLKEKVKTDLEYDRQKDCYYFRATPDLSERRLQYEILGRMRHRRAFMGYPSKRDATRIAYYRHAAFTGQFQCHDEKWYLEISPTYYFTYDGRRPSRFFEERLSGIKKLEKNPNVLAQVIMWAWYLAKPEEMFSTQYPFLKFGDLPVFQINVGIDDDLWLGHEQEQEAEFIRDSRKELPLFQQ